MAPYDDLYYPRRRCPPFTIDYVHKTRKRRGADEVAIKKLTKTKGGAYPKGLKVYVVRLDSGTSSSSFLMCDTFENAVNAYYHDEDGNGVITDDICSDQRNMLSLSKLKAGEVLEMDIHYKVIKPVECKACGGLGHLNKPTK